MHTDVFCRYTVTCMSRLSYLDYLDYAINSTYWCTIIHYPGAILKGLTGREMTGGWRGRALLRAPDYRREEVRPDCPKSTTQTGFPRVTVLEQLY